MSVHNLMEDIVKACMKELMHVDDALARATEQQRNDVMAIALNRLPPKYVTTEKGEIFSKTQLRAQVETDVYQELYRAMDRVLHKGSSRMFDKGNP
jgi:competence protein ComFB